MTETNKTTGEKLSVSSTKTLTLKRSGVEQGVVRQSFSHGRSKAVVVEKVKRRTIGPAEAKADAGTAPDRTSVQKRAVTPVKGLAGADAALESGKVTPKHGVVLRPLTKDELDARATALDKAERIEVEERKAAEGRAEAVRIQRAAEQKERADAEARKTQEEVRRAQEQTTKKRADELAQKRLGVEPVLAKPGSARVQEVEDDEAPRPRRGVGGAPVRTPPQPKPQRTAAEKRRGRLTLVTAFATDEVREHSKAAFHRRVQRRTGQRDSEPKEKIVREVTIPETITVQDLANRMSERSVDVVRMLMKLGHMATSTDTIDADTAQVVAEELGHTVRRVSEADVEEGMFAAADDPEKLQPRAPVVTIMGHVDHGKTSLLDAIRSTEVAAGEAGGITQHIGAYQVTSPSGGRITFIDTPGHAAFTAMRARGAKITDIVVLVVAADDGVMPQTVEAIQHARAAKVPIIVAINKIDKPDAKPERVRTELLQHEIQVESLGGEVLEVEVSAKEKRNLDRLLDIIALQAEILELKANPNRPAEGTVIEARLDRGRGPVATVLVQRGTLKPGDIVVAGSEWGRVRALVSDTGHPVVAAGPSMPVEILGFNGTPEASDRLAVVDTEARAREITDYRARQKREKAAARQTGMRGSLEQMMNQLKTSGRKDFPLVIKGDAQGSIEAIVGALEKLSTDEVAARLIFTGVGGITESDVTLAEASGAVLIGFNVRAHKEAREAAEQAGIEIRYYDIIYSLVDDVKKAMSGMLAPTLRETMLGNAVILEVFKVSKVGNVAGCRVTDGTVERGANVRLIRDSVVQHQGKLSQLKRFKDDAREVVAGQECGMAFENYQDMKAGDIIECYRVESVQRSL
ncbi:MAG: translation initiation factor IF-2 [Xanthobacteraceae bacterium]